MKELATAFAAVVLFTCVSLAGQEGFVGVESYEEALRLAEERKCDVYLVYKGRTCSWCERQSEVLSSSAAERHMKGVVLCVLDVQANRALASSHGVTSIPAHRLLRPDGTVEKSHTGFMNEREIKKFLAR